VSHIERTGGSGPPPGDVLAAAWAAEAQQTMGLVVAAHEGAWRREMEPSRRTGTSMRSLATDVQVVGGEVHGTVGTNYAPVLYVNEGTGLYGPTGQVIRPTRARALRFPEPGNRGFTLAGRQRSGRAGQGARWVYARYVRGIRPRRYAQQAAAEVRPTVLEIAEALGARLGARLRGLR
jgi:hypothetical protein